MNMTGNIPKRIKFDYITTMSQLNFVPRITTAMDYDRNYSSQN